MVIAALMPSGVEHILSAQVQRARMPVIAALMPSGVEHTPFNIEPEGGKVG